MSRDEKENYLVGLFDRVAEQARNGVLFLVDEAHKLGVDELREFGQAFQVARSRASKPFDVVVAGLPDLLAQAKSPHGATFLSRMQPNEIGLLTYDEVAQAFRRSRLAAVGVGHARGA